ncbi:MAG: hypothetical protein LC790_00590 [Actinobacteria bacterium]|nr:hypothetical protein [Actinomycetota bacterium]
MAYKTVGEASIGQLRARRRRLARALPAVEEMLRGTALEQGRRCGKPGCRCARGELHGPYTYLSLGRERGRARLVYVPAALAGAVRRRAEASARIEAALAEISEINAELLRRRELD